MPLPETFSRIPDLLAQITNLPRGMNDFTDLVLKQPISAAEIEELEHTCRQMRLDITLTVSPTEYGAEIKVEQR